jgi:hypothetical protein
MKYFSFLACALLGAWSGFLYAQKTVPISQKDKWYVLWGWNRDVFSKSDIHFWGDQYDFTLQGVDAHDKQEKFALDPYFHPGKLTIPQTNARIGYFFKPQYGISIGDDHMKYVMDQSQMVAIDGYIGATGKTYEHNYQGDYIYTSDTFLTFEHTDGLNYINTELRRHALILSTHKYKWLSLDLETFSGFGTGVLIPKTNVKLFGGERHDEYNLAGWGAHVVTGFGLTLWNHFLIQPEFKGGYINMPNIRTTKFGADGASQHFWFGELALMVGGSFRLWKE